MSFKLQNSWWVRILPHICSSRLYSTPSYILYLFTHIAFPSNQHTHSLGENGYELHQICWFPVDNIYTLKNTSAVIKLSFNVVSPSLWSKRLSFIKETRKGWKNSCPILLIWMGWQRITCTRSITKHSLIPRMPYLVKNNRENIYFSEMLVLNYL